MRELACRRKYVIEGASPLQKLTRREALLAIGGSTLSPLLLGETLWGIPSHADGHAVGHHDEMKPFRGIIGCAKVDTGYAVVVTDQRFNPTHAYPIPQRGHDVVVHPQYPLAVAIARRPGLFLQPINWLNGENWESVLAPSDRVFYGHGLFSSEGTFFYTTEGVRETSEGVLGIYHVDVDQKAFKRVGEWPINGIGPHELVWATKDILAIAVGGDSNSRQREIEFGCDGAGTAIYRCSFWSYY